MNGPPPLRLLLVTEDDPLYVVRFFEVFFDGYPKDEIEIVGISIKNAFGESLGKTARRIWRLYGPFDFVRLGARYARAKARGASIASLVARHGLPLVPRGSINAPEYIERVRRLEPDVIASVAAPEIFRATILAMPRLGCINIHSGRLPVYRGMMPTFWQLLHGEKHVVITVHEMVEELDAGAVLGTLNWPLRERDNLDRVITETKRAGARLMIDVLRRMRAGTTRATPLDWSKQQYLGLPCRRTRTPPKEGIPQAVTRSQVRRMPDAVDRAPKPMPGAALSIDVEDWFHVHNLEAVVARDSWGERQLRVERNMERMLELMAERGARCTCFVLGWVAEKCPGLIRRIAAAGHELATQGYGHQLLYTLSPAVFREDIKRGIGLVEAAGGQKVRGYRAPSFSITDWALDILQELGLEYDSSVFPIAVHDRYGRLSGIDVSECVAEVRPGLHEIFLSTLRIGLLRVPWAGGGYFRLLPYWMFAHGIRRILASGRPYVFYIHPWEIDPGQPRVQGLKPTHAFRHYNNLARGEPRFARLLDDFQWTTVADLLAAHLPGRIPSTAAVEPS